MNLDTYGQPDDGKMRAENMPSRPGGEAPAASTGGNRPSMAGERPMSDYGTGYGSGPVQAQRDVGGGYGQIPSQPQQGFGGAYWQGQQQPRQDFGGGYGQGQQQPAYGSGVTPDTPYRPPAYGQQGYPQPVRTFPEPANTRALAMLMYWGGLVGIVIACVVCDRNDPFVRRHLNQALVLAIASVGGGFLCGILSFLLVGLFLVPLLGLAVFIYSIIGTVRAYNGDSTPIPPIGNWEILKANNSGF